MRSMKKTKKKKVAIATVALAAGLVGSGGLAPAPASAMPATNILHCLMAGGEVGNGGDAGWYCILDNTHVIWL